MDKLDIQEPICEKEEYGEYDLEGEEGEEDKENFSECYNKLRSQN